MTTTDDTDNGIDVSATDDLDADDELTIPETLREIADRLEDDEDTQLLVGIVGVDVSDEGSFAKFNGHVTDDAFDDLSAHDTLHAIDLFNTAMVENAFKVGLEDNLGGGNPLGGIVGMMAGAGGSSE